MQQITTIKYIIKTQSKLIKCLMKAIQFYDFLYNQTNF